jgi:hypothetical protein
VYGFVTGVIVGKFSHSNFESAVSRRMARTFSWMVDSPMEVVTTCSLEVRTLWRPCYYFVR